MGQLIAEIASERGHHKAFVLEAETDVAVLDWSVVDVAIDFSQPKVAEGLCELAVEAGVSVVSGTTGWDPEELMRRVLLENQSAFLHATNMSVGVNVAFAANALMARLLGRAGGYRAGIVETHHEHKLDAPSGTAVTLAEGVASALPMYASRDAVPTESIREGEIFGIHEVSYTSEEDVLSLKHEAKSRRGFALGAVLAAEYLFRKRGIFTMSDVLGLSEGAID